MKYAFLTGLVLGFVGLLAAAGAYPWVQHPRLESRTEALRNGGRGERFVIRLPADRIGGFTAAPAAGARAAARPNPAAGLSIEEYKIRDTDGRVIGVAARHSADSAEGAEIAWLVAIPGRGALVMADSADSARALERALQRAGHVPERPWQGTLTVDVVTREAGETASFSAGTAEFEDLEVGFSESWSVTGVDEQGALRGTIELATVSRLGS